MSPDSPSLRARSQGPIGIFDSGLGGLAVLAQVRRILPHNDVLFLGDTARQPYGPRPIQEVERFAVENTAYLVQQGAALIIIACNTASVAGQASAQRRFPEIPVLGMIEPGVSAALESSPRGKIGVWGTAITVDSKAYDQAILARRPDAKVLGVACPKLLRLAEKGEIEDRSLLLNLAREYYEPMRSFEADTLVLGCTDLTCVSDIAQEIVGPGVILVDPAEAVVHQARQILRPFPTDATPTYRFMITGNDRDNFSRFTKRFMGLLDVDVETIGTSDIQQALAS